MPEISVGCGGGRGGGGGGGETVGMVKALGDLWQILLTCNKRNL